MAFVETSRSNYGSVVHTDGWLGYGLTFESDGYRHEVTASPGRATGAGLGTAPPKFIAMVYVRP